jgi:phage-related minor tail protein
MTTATHKAQLEVTANGDSLQAVAAQGKRSLRDLGQAARDASREAADGIREIGRGGTEAARGVDTATRQIERTLERTIASFEAGERGSRKFFESLAASRGADLARLQPLLDQLDAARAKAEAAAAAERQRAEVAAAAASRSAAAEQALANIRAAAQRAEREAYAAEQAALASAAKARQDFIAGLERQVTAIGKTRAELLELQAAQMGVSTQAAPFIARLRDAEKQLDKGAGAADQMAFAMRMIPMQMTDVVTSLVGGQGAFLVLLQQGGQIKDMFGGIGPAAKAMGSYVGGLVTPYTVVAAAAAALAVAHEQGASEARGYTREMTLSGNAAGVTAGQLQGLAAAVSAEVGTQASAAAALAALVATGRVGAEQMQSAGAAAVAIQRELGASVGETAKTFNDLGKAPLQTTLRLNEQYHYLTAAVLQQITALEREGKTEEAAAIAQQAYADAMKSRMDRLQDNLGGLEKAWRAVKSAASSAWDSMLDVGREQTLDDKVAAAAAKVAMLERQQLGRQALTAAGVKMPAEDSSDLDAAREQYRLLTSQAAAQRGAATAAAEQATAVEALAKWNRDIIPSLSTQRRMQQEITAAQAEAARAKQAEGANQAEIDQQLTRRIALIRQSYDTGEDVVRVQASEQQRLEVIKRAQGQIDLLRATGYINERTQIEETTRLDIAALEVQKQGLVAEQAIAARKINNRQEVARLGMQIANIDAQIETRRQDGINETTKLEYKQAQAVYAVVQAQRQEYADDTARAIVEQSKAREQLALSMYEQRRALQDQGEVDRLELSMMGASSQARQVAIAQLRIEQQLRQQIEKIKATAAPENMDAEAWRSAQIAQATQIATEVAAQAQTRVYLDEWQRMTDQLSQSLTDDIMRGGKNGLDYLVDYARTLVLRPIVQAVVQPLTGAIGSLLAPSATGSGAAGGISALSAVSTINSLYSAYTAGLTSTFANAIGSAGSMFGSSVLSSFASGMRGASMGAGLAGPTTAGSTGAMGLGVSAAKMLPVIGWIAAGMQLNGSLWDRGWQYKSSDLPGLLRPAGWFYDGLMGGPLLDKLFGGKTASMLTGSSLVARAFGRKAPRIEQQGIEGTFSGNGFTGNAYADIVRKGGWFRSDKHWTETSALDAALQQHLSETFTGLRTSVADMATSLGQPVAAIQSYSKQIRLAFTADDAANQQLLADTYANMGEDLAKAVLGQVGLEMSQSGETAAQTLSRLSERLRLVNGDLDALGDKLLTLNLASGDAASQLVDQFGGADAYSAAMQRYYESYYSDAERTATLTRQLTAQFRTLGYALPSNRAQLREWIDTLINGNGLLTDSGRHTVASLIGLSDAFATVTDSAKSAGQALRDEILRLRGVDGSNATNPVALWAQFAMQTSAARAGDASALAALPQLSHSLDELLADTSGSSVEYALARARLAASLEQTMRITVPAYADGGSHPGGLAIVGDGGGPELVDLGPSRVYSYEQTRSLLSTSDLADQLAALTRRVDRLVEVSEATAGHTADTSDRLRRLTDDNALLIREAD